MQDAGGDAADHHIAVADGNRQQLPTQVRQVEEANDRDHVHLDPSRYWLAGSAFPLIAGTLGPVANAFSILALVRPWRQHLPPGTGILQARYIEDPKWLLIINAIQVAIALVANIFLLFNMTKRLRFTVAQPVTIIGWYISSVLLVALTSTASGPLLKQPEIDYAWSQAYFYGIYAASLYFICSSLMVVTFLGAYAGRYGKDFQLTTSQRTLMLQTILFLMYLLLGALLFSRLEGWSYLDAVYWADVTLFTVGFGDLYAQTAVGRGLLFPYALVGIISLGLVIGSIRSLVLDRGRNKLAARVMEKKRRGLLKRMVKRGRDGILVPITYDDTDYHEGTGLTEFERREAEFKLMRKIQHQAARRRRWMAMGISSSTWVALWLAGAAIFQSCEKPYQDWSYFDGVYFCFVSLTTIGYGDMSPVSPAGKSFFVLWSMLALPATTVLISNAGDTIVKSIRDITNTLGSITILPGDRGFKKDLKEALRPLFFGILFSEDIQESPPGMLGDAETHNLSDSDGEDSQDTDDGEAVKMPQKGPEKSTGGLDEEVRGITGKTEADSGEPRRDVSPGCDDNRDGSADTTPTATEHSWPAPHHDGRIDGPKHKDGGPGSTSASEPSRHPNSHQPPHTHANKSASDTLRMTRAASMPRQTVPRAVPANPADYHVVLIDEIARVTQHLKSEPPRKYTFNEWAWYLRLIGEDESDAGRHRTARPHVHRRHQHKMHSRGHGAGGGGGDPTATADDYESGAEGGGDGAATASGSAAGSAAASLDAREGEQDARGAPRAMQWSWVGRRSPLLSSQEEAEWILEKLTQRLAKELRKVRSEERRSRSRSQRERETRGEGSGAGPAS